MESDRLLYYKGYTARPEYSTEDRVFYGTILGISDMVDFQSDSAEDLEDTFRKAVDDYLEFCAEIGKEPRKPVRAKADKKEVFEHFLSLFPEKGLDIDPRFIKKPVRAWDPDFTKVTPEEAKRIEEAERSGFIAEDDIDWNNLGAVLQEYIFKRDLGCSQNDGRRSDMDYTAKLQWDPEAAVWIATSDDIIGLVQESSSVDALIERVRYAVPELLELSHQQPATGIHFKIERYERISA